MQDIIAVLVPFRSATGKDPNTLGALTPDEVPGYENKVAAEVYAKMGSYLDNDVFDSIQSPSEKELYTFGVSYIEELASPVILGIEEPELLVRLVKKLRKQQRTDVEERMSLIKFFDDSIQNLKLTDNDMGELFSRILAGKSSTQVAFELREAAKILMGEVSCESRLLDITNYRAIVDDKMMREIESAPREWALALFEAAKF